MALYSLDSGPLSKRNPYDPTPPAPPQLPPSAPGPTQPGPSLPTWPSTPTTLPADQGSGMNGTTPLPPGWQSLGRPGTGDNSEGGGTAPTPNVPTPTPSPTPTPVPNQATLPPPIPNMDPNKPILGQIGVPTPQSGQSYGLNAADAGGTWNGNTFTPANNDWQAWFRNLIAKQPSGQQTLQSLAPTLARYGVKITPPNANGDTTKIGLPNGQWVRVIEGDPRTGSWTWVVQPDSGSAGNAGTPAATGVFSDPATSQWEQALNSLAGRLNQPNQNPYLQPLLQYMQQYFQQLQGPVYSPQQMDILQTQALDPLTAERDAARQRLLQRFSQQGITPGSGIAQQQLNQLDRDFERLRTQQQSGFAANAAQLQAAHAQQAGTVGAQLAALYSQNNLTDEQRALQAVSLLGQVPNMANTRLQLALQALSGNQVNPSSLLTNLNAFQNSGLLQNQQDTQYWTQIGQLIAQLIASYGNG